MRKIVTVCVFRSGLSTMWLRGRDFVKWSTFSFCLLALFPASFENRFIRGQLNISCFLNLQWSYPLVPMTHLLVAVTEKKSNKKNIKTKKKLKKIKIKKTKNKKNKKTKKIKIKKKNAFHFCTFTAWFICFFYQLHFVISAVYMWLVLNECRCFVAVVL